MAKAKHRRPDKTGAAEADERLRVALGSDHDGYRLKEKLALLLREERHAVKDFSVHNADPCDFPEIAEIVGRSVQQGEVTVGILVCTSGAGASAAANKLPGIRATYCQDTFTARQVRERLDANLLTLGARAVGDDLAAEIVRAWLTAQFSGEERDLRTLQRIERLEEQFEAERQALLSRQPPGKS